MKVIVTGAAGFIGSHIVDTLVKEKNEVIAIDNLSEGKLENLSDSLDKIKFLQRDIMDFEYLLAVFDGADAVCHQAALRSVQESIEQPRKYLENNILGTYNVFEAARIKNVKKVVFASSSSVYGEAKIFPQHEESKINIMSPYAQTKLNGEQLGKFFSDQYGMSIISLRYFNVFGPRQDPKSTYAGCIPGFISKILKDEDPIIFGDGMQSRDFVFIDDIVRANILALNSNGLGGDAVNICSGQDTDLLTIIELINNYLGKHVEPKHADSRIEPRKTHGTYERAKELLGYVPQTSFKQGLERTIDWYKIDTRFK